MRGFEQATANGSLGFILDAGEADHARVRLAVLEPWLQETGVVHGGVLAALADTACVYALRPSLPAAGALASIEFKINFFHPATAAGGTVVAQARVLHNGRRTAVAEAEVIQRERLVAKGSYTYSILAPE